MVVDTSILLAIYFNEKYSQWAADHLNEYCAELKMSTINLAETLIHLQDKQPQSFDTLEEQLLNSNIRFIPPTVEQSRNAAKARLEFPLNLGDCFAYALAKQENCPILTLDYDFQRLDCTVILPKRT